MKSYKHVIPIVSVPGKRSRVQVTAFAQQEVQINLVKSKEVPILADSKQISNER